MTQIRVCGVDDLRPAQMEAFFIEDSEVIVARDLDGRLHAFDGQCPHEDFPLVYGLFDGMVVTCANHMWSFDVINGQGISAPGSRLTKYAVEARDGDVYVDPSVELPPAPRT